MCVCDSVFVYLNVCMRVIDLTADLIMFKYVYHRSSYDQVSRNREKEASQCANTECVCVCVRKKQSILISHLWPYLRKVACESRCFRCMFYHLWTFVLTQTHIHSQVVALQ